MVCACLLDHVLLARERLVLVVLFPLLLAELATRRLDVATRVRGVLQLVHVVDERAGAAEQQHEEEQDGERRRRARLIDDVVDVLGANGDGTQRGDDGGIDGESAV
jgi:hypothetical protein